jgi:putative ABC transport system ATP-binding protein
VLIADEPTGQLDSRTAATVMDLIGELVRTQSIAAVVSTHDPLLVQRADRVIELHDGRITSEGRGGAGATPADAGGTPASEDPASDSPAIEPAPDHPLTRAELRARRND